MIRNAEGRSFLLGETVMPKFYVQSGLQKMVLEAADSRSAAIWFVHRTLSETLPVLCEDVGDYSLLSDVSRLGPTIRVSQRGFGQRGFGQRRFDCDDAPIFETVDIVTEWNQLLV